MKRKERGKFGNLAFFIPILIIAGVVAYGVLSTLVTSKGTLVVRAQSSFGGSARDISATATVAGVTGKTPFNFSVRQGGYTVIFEGLQWYQTPLPRFVTVVGGHISYAVGVYSPIPVVIAVGSDSFNATQVTAMHGITPVVWMDVSGGPVQIKSSLFNVVLGPGQNYTRVFTNPGMVQFSILGGSAEGTVTVL